MNRHVAKRPDPKTSYKAVDLRHKTPAERIGMMWELTREAWGLNDEECRMRRDIVVVRRLSDSDHD